MQKKTRNRLPALLLGTLGVVYGDIGTSPLYALQESLQDLPITPHNILGVLSLIFWTFILIISVKYLMLILKADNDGEGGVLALFALLKRTSSRYNHLLFIIAILGACALLGDGMLTPAISVLSAIEGLKVISPDLANYVVPITIIILVLLFYNQYHGTGKIGGYFGPIILIWFIVIGILGAIKIVEFPIILKAINPHYALLFFKLHKIYGYLTLGSIFLVITGGEALYADIGHFGKQAIRITWFSIALPCLLLNYFGQGANLIMNPTAIGNAFYSLAPTWFLYPLLILATLATIIASQAIITAVFSLVKQAILLDILPRLKVVQTSAREKGQVYVPAMNILLALGTMFLVIEFKSSSALANGYGLAVNFVMITTTLLVIQVARQHWHWSILKILIVFSVFILFDVAFLGANVHKIVTGGWFPLIFTAIGMIIMMSWHHGIELMRKTLYADSLSLPEIIGQLNNNTHLDRSVNTTAVFVTDPHDESGGSLIHHLKLNRILPEQVIIVSIIILDKPHVMASQRCQFKTLAKGFYRLNLYYGFMQNIDIPVALELTKNSQIFPFGIDVDSIAFFVETLNITIANRKKSRMYRWQKKLFAFLLHNALPDLQFYHLPYNRTIAIGTYCEI